ncbi:iron uptake transporter deferrochelatase/peroxidase subunit [Mycobacteroides chelonae]|uniref:Deferrochelatase n=1 Tax=Mycobacteroides chelonae TaxID=1774 RepID=A0AB73N347_MYCCH|nr:iron uptake transporter deferrochelatase/peroxidase subunit [Mycobacteroides chelonae]MBF9328354.1 deferrochelatase/peroxidase EfeB [Mycobacteroides chelonae]MBF9422532.1 deferrochelatase/peroxidase EfeB [Mycobacteroides chelonae]MBV6362389.1 deferrochelatase/peroxidase EfeB [Mycobacteroides chelonae]MEC4836943.1 iron uptake transporter deferrochelatase/peroxidase subunit [Mycobacteroides chelonae]MEC4838956.1 iron uptake transporter deferrochelatase/peroxidase subunit [Mycobacteroides chel
MRCPRRSARCKVSSPDGNGFNRRKLLGAAGVTAAVAGAAGAGVLGGRASAASVGPDNVKVPFRGEHQAGITTPAQDRMHFCAFDVMPNATRGEVQAMLRQWTEMAERMSQGEETTPGGAIDGNPYAPPTDTGEALDLAASALTLTIGFGPSFFRKDGVDRFGIADKLPAPLQELPKFRNEKLDPARCGGDICIQACADDPQVAVHAIRNLARVGFGTVAVKWSQLGFGRTSSTSRSQVTPRNLFGFKDGTRNIKAEDTGKVNTSVWVAKGDNPEWMTGGTYLVARRIRMLIESWDRTVLNEQERVIGRAKGSGAPIGQSDEFADIDFTGKKSDGEPLLDVDAHVRLASAEELGGIEILRRGYNFTDGSDGFGHLDAGLFFIAFVRNPQSQFIPMQRKLATEDALNEYILHTGSAIFACPPGLGPKEYWGQSLFG